MIVITMIDDDKGMLFNNRRQSRDKVLLQWIEKFASENGKRLLMNTYTQKMFTEISIQVQADERFLDIAEIGDICVVENNLIAPYIEKIEQLIVCKWNRRYPGDFHLDVDLEHDWCLVDTKDIVGNSHEKITIETYQYSR